MSSPSPRSPNGDSTTLTSNHFKHILEAFDEEGHLINPETRFHITCPICDEKDLAILNSGFYKRSRTTHESYAVLPRCQHAFGHTCLSNWIMRNINTNGQPPLCPSCRTPIFPSWKQATALEIYGDGNIEEQHMDIVNIRNSIKDIAELYPDPNARRPGVNPILYTYLGRLMVTGAASRQESAELESIILEHIDSFPFLQQSTESDLSDYDLE
ncbi:hypothetical protein F4821DRAFT_258332 [Hypoxylon rubiginosum]|uniref:Uncharacterized protein n=1 Tax=Hypoxylon rubiginosum TaxID=110542 RepID=A0ACC0D657_9PEZI|nr:hypothetical protein F4821DRAFT_258332 [Hypoxylon rubiginosum]